MHAEFIHLRTHSSYSLSEGAIKVDELTELCLKHKMPAIAITDNSNLFCALEFSKACSEKGIQPIIGTTLRFDPQIDNAQQFPHQQKTYDRIVLLAKNASGYKNLLKLVSDSFLSCSGKDEPHIKYSDLVTFHEGLICLTAGPEGTIGRLITNHKYELAEEFLIKLNKLFRDHLYIELMRHNLNTERFMEPKLIEFAIRYNIPLVATNDIYFATRDMHEAHDVLLCIADSKYLVSDDRRSFSPEQYFKSVAEMKALFADIPEAIENTIIIAQRCAIKSEESAPMLPSFGDNEDIDEGEQLRKFAHDGLAKRLAEEFGDDITDDNKQIYHDRLEYELNVIINMKFSGYFLIVSDFIKWSKRNDIPVGPGRGSGAGSLVAWSIEITDLNPLRFGLLFERFLNPERISMPDFDIDFCQERRDEVINYVRCKYGQSRVAQIITFGKLQARAVLRDVGRVLNMPYGQVDKIAKMVPFNAVNPVTLSQAIEIEPTLKKASQEDTDISKLLSIALKLEGLNRHASTHAAGIVISGKDLEQIVPLYRDPDSEMLVIQYSMKYAEAAGLVKFDFLGLKTLTVIANSCKLICEQNINLKITQIPLDDPKTYEMLSKGDSMGVFQFESSGMRDVLRKMRPDSIEDLIALGALYRPGPMENIPTYIACKHGHEQPNYLHPKLENVLKETFGVIIYQEQVIQIAQILAGYTAGAADLLRRAMGKKIKAEMDAQRQLFVSGAIANNVDSEQASSIFDLVAKFAGYGFNKSHAAAYAMISYQTAYLKANFTVEFLVASMNLEIDSTDKIALFKEEAEYLEIVVLPPDINHSNALFSIETLPSGKKAIRYGLGAIKNVGMQAMETVIAERKRNNKFKDIFDFANRIDHKILNKRQLENLAKVGAFDKLHNNRRQLFESIELLIRYSENRNKEKASSQGSLFDKPNCTFAELSTPNLIKCDDWDLIDRIQAECDAFGFYLTLHPLDQVQQYLVEHDIKNSLYLRNELQEGYSILRIAGIAGSIRTRVSPRGRYVSIQFSDPSGNFEVTIFNEQLLVDARDLINSSLPLLITVEARKDEGGARLSAQSIQRLDDFLETKYNTLFVWLDSKTVIPIIKSLCNHQNGSIRLKLMIQAQNHEIEVELPSNYRVSLSNVLHLSAQSGVSKTKLLHI